MARKSSNKNLHSANKTKQDEFYTQLNDIANELRHYRSQLEGKTILCNCDDPFESNFFKYFAANFNALKIKKLIATSFVGSPIVGKTLPLFEIEGLKPEGQGPLVVEINEVPDLNNDGAISLEDVEHLLKYSKNVSRQLRGDEKYDAGDFRSKECVELLKQADIVITNPPFSLFREFVGLLVEHNKDFLIIGNINAITYKDIFKLIKEERIWLGASHRRKRIGMYFDIPDAVNTDFATTMKDGKIFIGGALWFTTLDTPANHEPTTLYKKYTPEEYPTYDNYDAIEVSRTKYIPADYEGHMGVPITFLNSGYNPDQFKILGITAGREEFEARPIKRYVNPKQHNPDGSIINGSKANTRATISHAVKPKGIYYTADNAEGYLQILYARLLIKHKSKK